MPFNYTHVYTNKIKDKAFKQLGLLLGVIMGFNIWKGSVPGLPWNLFVLLELSVSIEKIVARFDKHNTMYTGDNVCVMIHNCME